MAKPKGGAKKSAAKKAGGEKKELKVKKPSTAQIKKALDDPKERAALIESAEAAGHTELVDALRSKKGRDNLVSTSGKQELKELQARQAEHWAKIKEREAQEEKESKRLAKLGLVELPVRGTTYKLVGFADPNIPKEKVTTEMRLEIAKRLNAVGPLLPRYIQHLVDTKKPVGSSLAVVSVASDIEDGKEYVEQQRKAEEELKKAARPPKGEVPQRSGRTKTIVKDSKPVVSAAPPAKKQQQQKAGGAKKFSAPKVPPGGFNKNNVPATSGELIRARIVEHKMTDEEIATEVRKLFPGRSTTAGDVRWNRGQMRKHGVDAPDPVGEAPQKGKK